MFGNPAKLSLTPNSRWLCDLRSREVCRLSIRFKEKQAWDSSTVSGGSRASTLGVGTVGQRGTEITLRPKQCQPIFYFV